MSVLSGLSENNVTDPCSLCNQLRPRNAEDKNAVPVLKESRVIGHIPYHLANTKNPAHWCSHSFYFKAYQPRIGVNRSGDLFTENTVCIFDGPRKHVDLLGMNNYRTLATTKQYERRLMLITASRGRQRERSRPQAMTAAKGQGSETFM